MHLQMTGREAAARTVLRAGAGSLALLALVLVSACTTVEGTNALSDPVTFEREVMNETAAGLGLIPRTEKDEPTTRRGPLVLPRDTGTLPPPQQASAAAEALPDDSATVQIDTANLTEADIRLLRNARVVDLRSTSGRPLTEAEARALTARMSAANIAQRGSGPRPLYLPPEEYFTVVDGQNLICRGSNGALVPLDDPACPPELRRQLSGQ